MQNDLKTKREQGEYYTPKKWVDIAHNYINKYIGNDWKKKYVVWDPAWGGGNLTKDYKFDNLFCSTLLEKDLEEYKNLNPEAKKFQYDYVNDDITDNNLLTIDNKLNNKAPELYKFINDKHPLIIFQNSPYGAIGFNNIKQTNIGRLINSRKFGKHSYANNIMNHFMFRSVEFIINNKINHSYICSFINAFSLTKAGSSIIRKYYYENGFSFIKGFCFKSTEYEFIKAEWCAGFIIYKYNAEDVGRIYDIKKEKFDIDLYKSDKLIPLSLNAVDITVFDWAKSLLKPTNQIRKPALKNFINPSGTSRNWNSNSIGFIGDGINNNYLTSSVSLNGVCSIDRFNFKEAIISYIIDKFSIKNWYREVFAAEVPNQKHPDYKLYSNDCIIYALFSESFSSLRNIVCNGFHAHVEKGIFDLTIEDIENEWFWMSNSEMKELAVKHNYQDLKEDCDNFKTERFIYNYLKTTELSPDATEILNHVKSLVIKSFEYREKTNQTPFKSRNKLLDKNLQTWDAGWGQIKIILTEHLPEDLKEFTDNFNIFKTRIENDLYKFGCFSNYNLNNI